MENGKAEFSHQTVNFCFSVEFTFKHGQKADVIGFQSVTGLDSTLETEPLKEGGENRFEHTLPVRRKYGPLTLKRGVVRPGSSNLTDWLKRTFDDDLQTEVVEPLSEVTITLLNESNENLMYWVINNVWPRSWKIGELNAEQGAVLIETLELNFNRLIFNRGK
jgi:phage tail-like protein